MTLEEMEINLKAVTDQVGRLLDQVQQKGFVPVFRCSHSGLYFPADYVKEWGRLYGIGLGPEPRSEVLDSDYGIAPPAITPEIRRIEQIMHPVRVCCAQVDLVLVAPAEAEAQSAILDRDDEQLEERAVIILAKQRKNPASKLPNMYVAWERAKGVR